MQILQRALCEFTNVYTCTGAKHIGVFCSTAFPSVCIVRSLDEFGILIMCGAPVAVKLASLTKLNSLSQNVLWSHWEQMHKPCGAETLSLVVLPETLK